MNTMEDLAQALDALRSSVVIVPTGVGKKKKRASSPSRERSLSALTASLYDPRNFLIKGGTRTLTKDSEDKLVRLSEAAIKDLRTANSLLAKELLRLRTAADEEATALKQDLSKAEMMLQSEREKTSLLKGKLSEEIKGRDAHDSGHHAKLKEVALRLKEEHRRRVAAEAELKQVAEAKDALVRQVSDLDHERQRLQEAISTVGAEARALSEVRGRLATSEDAARELQHKVHNLGYDLEECNGLIAKLRADKEHLARELTARQSSDAVQAAQASADRNDLERARRDIKMLRAAVEELDATRKQVFEAEQTAKTQRSRAEALAAEASALRSELEQTAAVAQKAGAAREERVRAEYNLRVSSLTSDLERANAATRELQNHLQLSREEGDHLGAQLDAARQDLSIAHSQLQLAKGKLEELTRAYTAQQHKLAEAEAGLNAREQSMAEVVAAHRAQSDSWRAEAAGLSDSLASWKSKANAMADAAARLEQELAHQRERHSAESQRKEALMDQLSDGARAAADKLAASESAASSEVHRLAEQLRHAESALRNAEADASRLRAHNGDLGYDRDALHGELLGAREELKRRDAELERAAARLAEEAARAGKMRAELAAATSDHMKEVDQRNRAVSDLTAALHAEERARAEAAAEAAGLRQRLGMVEGELDSTRGALSATLDAKSRAEDAHESARMALKAAQRQATAYRREKASILSDYDEVHAAPRLGARLPSERAESLALGGGGLGDALTSPSRRPPIYTAASPSRAAAAVLAAASPSRSRPAERSTAGGIGGGTPYGAAPASLRPPSPSKADLQSSFDRYDRLASQILDRTYGRPSHGGGL
uniref:95 kD basal apparatus-protein n=1 Tax=Spermatozopsis similis TaxID=3192 RepID=O49944_SPESI|nr:95 kD basal apparatus-protein [Spermatozopsis similis]